MLNKICPFSNKISPKKAVVSSMIAGTILLGGLTSCNIKKDSFNKEKTESHTTSRNNLSLSFTNIKKELSSSEKVISNLKYISEKDPPLKNLGKRLSVGLLTGFLGSFMGILRKNHSILNTASQCAAVGAIAGTVFPGLALTAIITALATVTGGIGGTFLSGNEKIGKICATVSGILAAAACIL